MNSPPIKILFLCTHNSARSILAEATLNHLGAGRFKAWSAGSSPRENQQPHPLGLRVLRDAGISTESLHSKSWDEFAAPGAPQMDLVITVCDNAAGEQCPYWPGQPATAHWGFADPSEAPGTQEQQLEAFRRTLAAIRNRVDLLLALPTAAQDTAMLQDRARALAAS
jgi:arsenate reductase (thioredoxin)